MRVLIVGCGYVGLPLGEELVKQGHQVYGLRRSDTARDELIAAGIQPLSADITRPEDLTGLPTPFDWVIFSASSSKGGVEDYEQIYLRGVGNLIECLQDKPPLKFVYLSSTSVYGQTDGSLVKETGVTEPSTPTGRLLVQAEQQLLEAVKTGSFPGIILRVAGIYGPDRGHLFLQYLRNEAKIIDRGERLLNMIHRDDLVTAIITTLKSGRAGETYNVVDDEPVAQIHFFRWLSETLGKWMPPSVSAEEAPPSKRGRTNKKVSNRRLKMELGMTFKYPTFRQGYTAEITRLDRAGQLHIEPEPR